MSQKRFSREGFRPLPGRHDGPEMVNANTNDATIDIPLITVNSRTGARRINTDSSLPMYQSPTEAPIISEKSGHMSRGPGAGGRRRKLELNGNEEKTKDDGTLGMMGKVYLAVYNFSIITRYFIYVLPLALMIAVPVVVGATVAPNARLGGVKIVWFFAWVEVVWLSLWVSKLVAQFLPHLFQFLCGIVSSGVRKYALVLTALEIPLSLVGWALASLATFMPLMRRHRDSPQRPWENVVQQILAAACFSTLALLVEKFLIQLISISYHRKQFDSKIKDSKRNIHLLSLLYHASRHLFPAYCTEFAAEDYIISNSIDLVGSKAGSRPASNAKHRRSGSATPMRVLQNVGRVGDKLTAAFGDVAHEITGKQVFNPTSAHSIVVEALEKTTCSEALARRLWMSFVVEGHDALYREDIVDVLGPDRAEDAEECFYSLDRDGNGDISLDEMILTVCEFGKERYTIANSMHDVDQAINVLDNLLCIVVFVMVVFIFVAFLNHSFVTTLATTGTALLSLSFVFSVSAQEVLGSCIFIFVKHPYDVGDRVDIFINGLETQLVIDRISLLYTVFRRVQDHKCTQVANIVLNTTWIDNISRSKAMREQIFLYINADTTLDDIQLLRNEMLTFVLDKDNSRDFQSDIDVELTGLNQMDKLELKVEIRHKSNWANEAVRAARRSKFMCALVLALRKVPIYGPGGGAAAAGEPANPTYSVTISNEVADANKKEFAHGKDKKRMIPASAASTKPVTNVSLSPNVAKSSEYSLNSTFANLPPTIAAKDASVLRSFDASNAAMQTIRDESNEEVADVDRKRSSDLEEVRDLLRQGSVTGRRRVPSVKKVSSGPVTVVNAPVRPSPISELPPKVDYYEETNEYYPSTAESSTGAPQEASGVYESNNTYTSPPRTASQSQSHTTSPVSNRRPIPGNAFSRFPVAPNTTQDNNTQSSGQR